jgi:hypothetical protein
MTRTAYDESRKKKKRNEKKNGRMFFYSEKVATNVRGTADIQSNTNPS